MELYSLQSITVTRIPRRGFTEKPFLCGQTIKPLPYNSGVKRCPDARKLKFLDCRAQASGTTKFSSVAPETNSKDVKLKDGNVVFVAGATGKVGSRTVRELLKLGFQVRAGVRSIQRAEPLVKSVKQIKLDNVADGGTSPIERLEIVECDLEKSNIVRALGNASTVICCIGASEKEIFDITGPYRIDYQATKNLIDAATTAKVGHFILLTSLGTSKFGFPAAILNLFWGVLCWKRRAEEALLASGLPYTIVRPGGMERPTDTYKETHNITLSQEDTLFGGQVSNLQVAELMAFMVKNPTVSYYKVVEVIAETTAPLTPLGDLLTKIPSKQKVYPAKEPAKANQPAVSAVTTPEIPRISTEKESTPALVIEAKPLSPYTAYADLKPPTSPSPNPPSSRKEGGNNIVDKVSSPAEASKATEAVETNLAKVEVQKTRPLSPYTAYEDLKPPTSPTPPQSRSKASTIAEVEVQLNVRTNGPPGVVENDLSQNLTSCHSPYAAYENLKPPTSPTPTPSGPKASKQLPGGNNVPTNNPTNVVEKETSRDLTSCHSPYLAYDDLKPPTSPSPSVPIVSQSNTVQPPVAEKPEGTTFRANASKERPLSPYTAYEDLKPPSSPSPSPKL